MKIAHDPVNNITTNQNDYKGHNAPKPDLQGARDNLKFKKDLGKGPTEYQREYTKKDFEPGTHEKMKQFKKVTI